VKIAMIVPNLPPTVCGVYDYTRKLAEHWPTSAQWTLVCPNEGKPWPGATAVRIQRSAEALSRALAALRPDAVGLQYTCYGYARNGVPAWIADGLEVFKRTAKTRLAVMFHEVSYDGAIWRRAHWRKPKQEALAKRLCKIADAALTGIPERRQALSRASGREVVLAAIPSNIEPLQRCAHESPVVFGVFGLPASRAKALAGHKRLIATLAKDFRPIEVREIGADKVNASSDAVVSRQLAACNAVLSPYEAVHIWKSGAAMAAFAHGCAVIALGTANSGGPPVLTYVSEAEMRALANPDVLKAAGITGKHWYEANSGWPRAVSAWRAALAR